VAGNAGKLRKCAILASGDYTSTCSDRKTFTNIIVGYRDEDAPTPTPVISTRPCGSTNYYRFSDTNEIIGGNTGWYGAPVLTKSCTGGAYIKCSTDYQRVDCPGQDGGFCCISKATIASLCARLLSG
jgi:hypothetical protein